MPISADRKLLKDNCPSIVIGTPGRMLALSTKNDKPLDLSKVKYFVLDECDQMLKAIGKAHSPVDTARCRAIPVPSSV